MTGMLFWKEELSQVPSTWDKTTDCCWSLTEGLCFHRHSAATLKDSAGKYVSQDPKREPAAPRGSQSQRLARLSSQIGPPHTPERPCLPCLALEDCTYFITGLSIRPNQSPNPPIFVFGFLSISIATPQVLEPTTEILPLISTCMYTVCSFLFL